MKNMGDTARINYEMARWELIYRIDLRDRALNNYIVAIGAIFTIAFSRSDKNYSLLLIIPFIALGTTIITEQHNAMIGRLGYFLSEELGPFFDEIDEYAPHWDHSRGLLNPSLKAPGFLNRVWGHALLLITPSLIALYLNYHLFNLVNFHFESIIWYLDFIVTVFTTISIFLVEKFRKHIYKLYK